METKKILIIEKEKPVRKMLSETLTNWSFVPVEAESIESALKLFDVNQPVLTLLDANLSKGANLDFLKAVKLRRPDAPILMITEDASGDSVNDAIRAGADDFITKPFNLDNFQIAIENCLQVKKSVSVMEKSPPQTLFSDYIANRVIGKSDVMKELLLLVQKVAESNITSILLQGESGTGKDLIAKAIHFSSVCAANPFVAINCAAIPAHLVESELFGYEKGAFTDAKTLKKGLFEQADGGTIFLDEIGELEISLQAKLLRVLEENTFRRVGGLKDLPLESRIVAASNTNLREAADNGKFRQDLYFRLSVIEIVIPPLRERGDDVLLLADHFIKMLDGNRPELRRRKLSPDVVKAFRRYYWAGNVRELRNSIERALILEDGEQLTLKYLPAHLNQFDFTSNGVAKSEENYYIQLPPNGISLDDVEDSLIQQALKRSRGNVTRAAELLNLSRDQLRYRLKKKVNESN